MSVVSKLISQTKYLLGSNLFAAGLNFLSILILVKILDVKLFGYFALLQAYILVCAALFNPQAWQGFIKYVANNSQRIDFIIKHTMRYDVFMSIIGSFLAFILSTHYVQLMNIDAKYVGVLQLMSLYILFTQLSTSIGLPK